MAGFHEKRRVVVTGLGVATALGLSVSENWEKLLAGVSGIRELSLPQSTGSPVRAAGEIGPAEWERIRSCFPQDALAEGERRTLFALWAGRAALSDAGLVDVEGPRDRYGIQYAAGLGIVRLEDLAAWMDDKGDFDAIGFGRDHARVHPESIIRNSPNRPACLLSSRFSLNGPCCTVTSACASGTQAIGLGYRQVARGEADVMLVGGSDSMIHPMGLIFFHLLSAASVFSGDPREACRPFDRKRSGLVIGEGAGFAVLEEQAHALQRGARIHAEVVGYGSCMDAFRVAAPDPRGRGAARAMSLALEEAGLNPWDVDYINAHGTGTKQNDLAETVAIKNVFQGHADRLCVSSSKSMMGHLMAAAGGPEFVYTVLSVRDNQIHPTLNLVHPDPKCDLDYVPREKRCRTVRAALSNSFGFGGQNAVIAVKKYLP